MKARFTLAFGMAGVLSLVLALPAFSASSGRTGWGSRAGRSFGLSGSMGRTTVVPKLEGRTVGPGLRGNVTVGPSSAFRSGFGNRSGVMTPRSNVGTGSMRTPGNRLPRTGSGTWSGGNSSGSGRDWNRGDRNRDWNRGDRDHGNWDRGDRDHHDRDRHRDRDHRRFRFYNFGFGFGYPFYPYNYYGYPYGYSYPYGYYDRIYPVPYYSPYAYDYLYDEALRDNVRSYDSPAILRGLSTRWERDGDLIVSWSGTGRGIEKVTASLLDDNRVLIESRADMSPPYRISFRSVPSRAVFLQIAILYGDGTVDVATKILR